MFINNSNINQSWQSFERLTCRYLLHAGYTGIRLVGQTHDKGADVIAHKAGKRWLIQVKHWTAKIGPEVIDRTLESLKYYRADVPVIVSLNGFQPAVFEQQVKLMAQRIPLQLWPSSKLIERALKFDDNYPLGIPTDFLEKRKYQEDAIKLLVHQYIKRNFNRALVVLATGLGKTHVACEFLRRVGEARRLRVLILAHTNELVYQLERSFWIYLKTSQETLVWNGLEPQKIDDLNRANLVFACLNTVADNVIKGFELPIFDVVLIDECHHVSDDGMYSKILNQLGSGERGGPFLIGLTATPWRPDESDLQKIFGDPLICLDLVTGLKNGFLTNVDYRMYTDNIDWEGIGKLQGENFSPKKINRTLFITNWDDAVVFELKRVWIEQVNPRGIVFCGTIDHAITMRDRINSLGFCRAEAIYSQTKSGISLEPFERNRILCDFHDGTVQIVCAVDIFNEGVDVPDVNIIVFQRVTHSRRIFIQQLGRGLRLSKGKDKVIILDFVSDIRRFAAGIDLKDSLASTQGQNRGKAIRIRLPNNVEFRRVGGIDKDTETFLRQWLDDVAAIENSNEDASILKYPPKLPGSK